ncbi:MAG: decaprenyl-phosphate phosphoribosyltransferase [Rhodospirillales bacterium]|nr:decaprenyl-phosphate phosphoribosyltransferase [Rhodospirillales bacterium]
MSDLIRLARPKHWVKNAFVAAPLFFTPDAITTGSLAAVALAMLAFSLAASAVYIVNDYFDREADRLHPQKRDRPLASGRVSGPAALALATVLVLAALALCAFLPAAFGRILALYLAINAAYSAKLKHVSLLDVLIVAGGFVLRVEAGAAAAGVTASVWIVVCTGLLALFLALAKRRDDLTAAMGAAHRGALDGYNLRFVDTALAVVLGALLVSYVIYTTDANAIRRYGTERLYLTVPFVVAGVLRYLQIALVEERSGSPTDLAVGDRFLLACVLGWVAVFGYLIYA